MAGTVTKTEKIIYSIKKITFNWTATTGVADGTTLEDYDGEVLRIVNLATSSTKGNVLIKDSDGIDLLGGQGTSFSSGGNDWGTSTGGTTNWSPLSAVSGKVTLGITGGSTGSTGITIVYIR